uniref:Uncharacterized protein n=1 Tax=Panagrolaimus sp. PS1159 TaxID=55785 RepID=A0AC35GHE8_9BILA
MLTFKQKTEEFFENSDLQKRKDLNLFGKSNKLIPSNWLQNSDSFGKELNDSNSSENVKNNRTLSLHISAYKNSINTSAASEFNVEKKSNGIKKFEKQLLNSTLIIQNPFEFPRQQENDENSDKNIPEIAQFKASQKLLNPKESIKQRTRTVRYLIICG